MALEDSLRRWREAGLLDDAQAAAIQTFERDRQAPQRDSLPDRPGVIEAVLYLGLAVATAGAIVLVAQSWEDLRSWARVAVTAVPAALAILAGFALRRFPEPGLRRAGSVAWLAALGLSGAAVAVTNYEAGVGDDRSLLYVGVAATLLAAALWLLSRGHLQLIGMAAALVVLAEGIGKSPDDYSAIAAGMSLFAIGAAGVLFSERGMLVPSPAAPFIFAALAIAGPYHAGLEGSVIWAELLVFVVGIALMVLAVWRDGFHYMIVAVAGMFVGLITFVFEHLADSIGVALSLLLCGGGIVAGVLLLRLLWSATRERT